MSSTFRVKTYGLVTAGTIAVLAAFAATPAHASVELQLQSGAASWNQTGADFLVFAHSIGSFDFSGDLGLPGPGPSLDLSSANMSSSKGGTLVVTLSENNLNNPIGLSNWLTQFSGNFVSGAASVTLKSYVDLSNTLLGTGTLLSSLNASSSPFALSNTKRTTTTSPFALTEVLTIRTTGASNTSLDSSVTAVPEPASVALFGSALFGLGMVRRKGRSLANILGRKDAS